MSVRTATSLSTYLKTVAKIRDHWKIPRRDELWFRAEDASYGKTHLQPGLYRPRPSGKRKSAGNLQGLENDLYEEFRRCAPQLSDAESLSDDWEWDSYFLMQHHGVPTRILDWSDGALIALHFAIRDKKRPIQTGAIIYVLHPYWLLNQLKAHQDRSDSVSRWKKYASANAAEDKDEWERLYLPPEKDEVSNSLLATPVTPMLWDSPHVTRRVAAQRSRFIIFGTDPSWLARLADKRGSRLVSITIPPSAVNGIKQELRDAGVTESVVYPDLDGLGRELRQVWEMRR